MFDHVRTAKFRFVLGRHEQGCVHMADGYARATGRRGYNIQTLNVGPTEDGTVSRMKIDVLGTEKVVNQIILQLRNCVNVIEVTSRRR